MVKKSVFKIGLMFCIFIILSSMVLASSPCLSSVNYDIGKEVVKITITEDEKDNSFIIGGADPKTFKSLDPINCDNVYARDETKIFYKGKLVKDANAPTFIIYKEYFGRDLNNIYAQDQNINDKEIRRLKSSNWFVSSKDVFYKNILIEMKPDNLELIEDGNGFYAKDNESVYFKDVRMEGADPETFKIMHGLYASDKNGFYHEKYGKIEENKDSYLIIMDSYTKSSEHVFNYKGEVMSQYDANSFKEYRQKFYTKDNNGVYYKDVLIEGADPTTFQAVALDKAKDINNIYEGMKVIGKNEEGMDPVSNVMYVEETKVRQNKDNIVIETKTPIKEKDSFWDSIIRFLLSWKRLKE